MNIYEILWIVWSQFCTDGLQFIYIRSTSNIYWFIGIRIHCQQILMNSYSVTFGYSQYLVQHSMNDTEGKKTTICCYLEMSVWNLDPVLNLKHLLTFKFEIYSWEYSKNWVFDLFRKWASIFVAKLWNQILNFIISNMLFWMYQIYNNYKN